MKKLLGSVAALALMLSFSQANAELLKNFKFGGSVEMNATSAQNVLDFQTKRRDDTTAAANTKGQDRIGQAQTRIAVSMDWDLLDDVHSRVTLAKANRVYGQNTGAGPNGEENITNLEANLFIAEAFFKIDKVFGYVDTTFGRQFYGDEGDIIVYYGPKHNLYGMPVTAIDGARFDWSGEKAYATIAVFRPQGATNAAAQTGSGLSGQIDVRGLVMGTKGMEELDAKVYIWNQATHLSPINGVAGQGGAGSDGSKNDNLYIAGLKVKGKFGGAWASLEAAKNFGQYRTNVAGTDLGGVYSGWAALFDAGMKAEVEGIGAFTPWGQFGFGSGRDDYDRGQNANFQDIATDYRPGGIYGRFSQGATVTLGQSLVTSAAGATQNPAGGGLSNRIIMGAGVKATPSALNKLTAGVSYWDYKFHKLGYRGYQGGTPVAQLDPLSRGNKHIGYEIDADFEWKHSENVSFKFGAGSFQPGGFIKEYKAATDHAVTGTTNRSPDNPAVMSYFDVSVKF